MASPYLGGVHRHGGCCNQFRGIVSRAGEPTPAPIGGTHPSVGWGGSIWGPAPGGVPRFPDSVASADNRCTATGSLPWGAEASHSASPIWARATIDEQLPNCYQGRDCG